MNTAKAEQILAEYVRFCRREAPPAPASRVVEPQTPLGDPAETDCWTHAWTHAAATGERYVEGICRRPGRHDWGAHAWCERDTPFGPVVVELTAGYEQAHSYRGFSLDPEGPFAAGAQLGPVRYSVLQYASLRTSGDFAHALLLSEPAVPLSDLMKEIDNDE